MSKFDDAEHPYVVRRCRGGFAVNAPVELPSETNQHIGV